VAFRPKPVVPQKRIAPGPAFFQQHRAASDDATSKYDSNEVRGANESQLPHVTEEAAAIDKVTGNTPPDIEQGTPVQEVSFHGPPLNGAENPNTDRICSAPRQILKRDKDAQEKAPEVLKQDIRNSSSAGTNKTPSGSRSFSTSARRNSLELQPRSGSGGPPPDTAQFQGTRIVGLEYPDAGLGHKFPIPDLKSLGKAINFKKRYDPVVEQVTRSLMRDGKLSRAQKV
jgi:small subunit ribosomal protein S7